jgi:hypothetical protein
MSSGNYQQKKSRPVSLIPKDRNEVLGRGEEQDKFYSAAHKDTVAVYMANRLAYKNTPEQDAEEMFFDRIMTPDGDFVVERQVTVLTRFKTYDMKEWLMIQEELFGLTPIGNPHRYIKQRDISAHDEPAIEQRMVPGSGEQIRKKGESVLFHKLKYDIPFTTDAIADAFTRVKEPLRLQLYAHEQGQRPYRIRERDIWENYDWKDLMKYCKTGETKESRAEKIMTEMRSLNPEDKVKIIEVLLAGANQAGMQITMNKAEPTTNAESEQLQDAGIEPEDKSKKGKK